MSSNKYEVNDYKHDLDLLITLHWFFVSYPMRSWCRKRNIHPRHVVLKQSIPIMIAYLKGEPTYEQCVVRCGSKLKPKDACSETYWTMCAKYVNHRSFKTQHIREIVKIDWWEILMYALIKVKGFHLPPQSKSPHQHLHKQRSIQTCQARCNTTQTKYPIQHSPRPHKPISCILKLTLPNTRNIIVGKFWEITQG